MQTSATLFTQPPVSNTAELIGMPASAEHSAAAMETSVTTALIAIVCSSLFLALAVLTFAAIAPAGLPDAETFLNVP